MTTGLFTIPSGGARARLDYPDGRNRVETDRFNLAAAARRSRSAPRSWSPHSSPALGESQLAKRFQPTERESPDRMSQRARRLHSGRGCV